MRSVLILFLSFSPLILTNAQEEVIGTGRLIVDPPSNPLTCEAATVQWIWTGSSLDAETNTVSVAVEQVTDSNNRRSLSEPSPIRFIRKRSESRRSMHGRDNAINIAGGSSIPMSAGTWTWNSVGVPTGAYRMALTIDGQGITAFSDDFTVTAGSDTSCLGSLGTSASSTQQSSSTSATPHQTSSLEGNNSNSSTSSVAAVATNPSSFTTPETAINQQSVSNDNKSSSKGLSPGGTAAAVIVPLIAVGVLLWMFCMRRKNQQSQERTKHEWSEKFSGFFAGGRGKDAGHRRQISGPMDPVHAAGLAMHDHGVKQQMRQAGGQGASMDNVTRTPEHWVDFNPDVQDTDAHLVTPQRVEEMVRASMDQQAQFYQQGNNAALRQSTITDRHLTMETESDGNSSLPSYLRDADFASRHTESSFGHEASGEAIQGDGTAVPLDRSPTLQNVSPLTRSDSKVRRKPVPVYSTSTIGDNQATAAATATAASSSSTSLASDSDLDGTSPFSDVHEANTSTSNEDQHNSSTTAVIQEDKVQEMSSSADQEILLDSPTLPHQEHTPALSSRSFPVSVYSSGAESPAQRVLLESTRESLNEDQRKELYKLSIQLPQEDRGFRVSF